MGPGSASGLGVATTRRRSRSSTGSRGGPVLAWTNYATSLGDIYVKRFEGTTWVEIGSGSASGAGVSGGGGAARDPRLAFAASGDAYLAWSRRTTTTGRSTCGASTAPRGSRRAQDPRAAPA